MQFVRIYFFKEVNEFSVRNPRGNMVRINNRVHAIKVCKKICNIHIIFHEKYRWYVIVQSLDFEYLDVINDVVLFSRKCLISRWV